MVDFFLVVGGFIRGFSVIKGHVHFERVEALGRLSADVEGKGAAGILVQVENVRLEHVGPREGLPAEQAADQAWKNKGQKA